MESSPLFDRNLDDCIIQIRLGSLCQIRFADLCGYAVRVNAGGKAEDRELIQKTAQLLSKCVHGSTSFDIYISSFPVTSPSVKVQQ